MSSFNEWFFSINNLLVCLSVGAEHDNISINLILIELVVFTYIFIYVYNKLQNGCKNLVENWGYDSQVSKSNLSYVPIVQTPLFKCSN